MGGVEICNYPKEETAYVRGLERKDHSMGGVEISLIGNHLCVRGLEKNDHALIGVKTPRHSKQVIINILT